MSVHRYRCQVCAHVWCQDKSQVLSRVPSSRVQRCAGRRRAWAVLMPSPRNASTFSIFTTICSGVCFENFLMVIHSVRPQAPGTTQNNPLKTNGPKNSGPSTPRAFDETSPVPDWHAHNEASPQFRGEASSTLGRKAPTRANPHPSSTGAAYPLPSTTASRRGSRRPAGWVSRARSRGPRASRGCDRRGSTCPCRHSARARWCGIRRARSTGCP